MEMAKTISPARSWAYVFTAFLVMLCAMPAHVLAAVAFTNDEYYLHAGSPFTITWEGNRGPVSLALMNGPDENLKLVVEIVNDYDGTEYTWTPPADLPADSYIIRLSDAGSTDYSPRFKYPAPPDTGSSKPSQTSNSSSSTSSPDDDSDKSNSPALSTTAIAVIGALGGALLLAFLGLVAYYIAYRKLKRRYQALANNDVGSFGGHDDAQTHYGGMMDPRLQQHNLGGMPLTPVYGSQFQEHAAAASQFNMIPSPSSAGVAPSGSTYFGAGGAKMEGQYGYAAYPGQQSQGQDPTLPQPPAELPERGQQEAELSAEGRYQK